MLTKQDLEILNLLNKGKSFKYALKKTKLDRVSLRKSTIRLMNKLGVKYERTL